MEKKQNDKKTSATMKTLMSKLDIDESYTLPIKYHYPKVKNQVFPQHGFNYEADLLELPKTKKGYSYLLTVDDIYSNYCDFEPLKTKTSEEVLKAFKTIFKRGILSLPQASIRTDNGSEFKSVVDRYMYDNNILHRWSLPDRHKQMGNIENLNRQLGRVFMTYINNKSMELDSEYTDWTDIIDDVRHEINELKNHPKDIDMDNYIPKKINIEKAPKFKVGDLVYRRLEKPLDRFGNKYQNSKFRQGDNRFEINEPRKIVQVLVYTSNDPYRYLLNGLPNVSYAENELLPAKETEEKRIVKKIIDKKVTNRIVYYKTWFKGELKRDAIWLPKKQLLEDGLKEYIQEYENGEN